MESPKFQIGDTVKFCKTSSHGACGKIWAIYEARRYFMNLDYDRRMITDKVFSLVDDEWKEKYIYFVALDKPYRTVTYEEFVERNGLKFNPENYDLYEKSIVPIQDMSGPEEDFILIKEVSYTYV